MENVHEKLLRYAAVDTKSDPESPSCPSTPGQLRLGAMLVEELRALGLTDAAMDENGYVFATLEATPGVNAPVIGFLAHMDTSPDYPGECTHPQIIRYEGGDIVLNDSLRLTPEGFPLLENLIGQELIVTDGSTLLGADDKAGIAEIMSALEYLVAHPEMSHGRLRIGFTPDEEIGRGPHRFDVARFGADFAYTLDGGPEGELEYESFNAAEARIQIRGESIHPGTAKDKLINAALIGMELQAMLPVQQRPEYTDGYEGFYLLTHIEGSVEACTLRYIIRDHDRTKFENKKALLEECVRYLCRKYGERIALIIEDTYYNMGDVIQDHMELVDTVEQLMTEQGIRPIVQPIRGGTDGSQLSYMGLPTPNIFTGGMNFHGPYELISIPAMRKAVRLIVSIAHHFAAQ